MTEPYESAAGARMGDRFIVRGHHQGEPDRDGEIIEVLGENGAPPYRVRWEDGHTSRGLPRVRCTCAAFRAGVGSRSRPTAPGLSREDPERPHGASPVHRFHLGAVALLTVTLERGHGDEDPPACREGTRLLGLEDGRRPSGRGSSTALRWGRVWVGPRASDRGRRGGGAQRVMPRVRTRRTCTTAAGEPGNDRRDPEPEPLATRGRRAVRGGVGGRARRRHHPAHRPTSSGRAARGLLPGGSPADLRANDRRVIADLTSEPLDEALKGGLHLLKMSNEEVVAAGLARSCDADELFGR